MDVEKSFVSREKRHIRGDIRYGGSVMGFSDNNIKILEEELPQYGFEINDLDEKDYFVLLKILPHYYEASRMMAYLIEKGYMKADSLFTIKNIQMSTRLKNILKNYHIFYLPQLKAYPKESICNFRNFGKVCLKELMEICADYGVEIRSIKEVKDSLQRYGFYRYLYLPFFNHGIFSLSDFKGKTTGDLYKICFGQYSLTMETYDILKKNGIKLREWEDVYLFEVLPYRQARRVYHKYNVMTVRELWGCSDKEIRKMGIGDELNILNKKFDIRTII